uniref:Akirin n=1 Tax=Ditylenchus dipsaci TaxID=166011 RepID=A0A915E594_9BILA
MTCGLAVKRPHDYEAYLSPESGLETKRPRPANQPHCSPFRPQLNTLAASLMQSSSASSFSKDKKEENEGPLGQVSEKSNLTSTQLEAYLRAEIQYLKRRKLIPQHRSTAQGQSSKTKSGNDADVGAEMSTSSTTYRSGAVSPSSCHSGSDSDSETGTTDHQKESSPQMSIASLYDKPQFSLKQVKMICERLLKEQEIRLRYEYETALNKKLEEQHESYVQFAKEQIDCRTTTNDFFYLS